MPYADAAAVKVRAGRLAEAWTDSSTPGDADIAVHLATFGGEIDALLAARGADVPLAVGSPGALALKGLNADGALVLLIDGTWPGQGADEGVRAIRAEAIKRRDLALEQLAEGTHAAIVYLESLATSAGATDFWSEEPDYPTDAEAGLLEQSPAHAPGFARGMKL